MSKRSILGSVLVALVLAATSCSSGTTGTTSAASGGSTTSRGEAQIIAQVLEAAAVEGLLTAGQALDNDDAQCLAQGIVDQFGVARLDQLGLNQADVNIAVVIGQLTPSELEVLTSTAVGCGIDVGGEPAESTSTT